MLGLALCHLWGSLFLSILNFHRCPLFDEKLCISSHVVQMCCLGQFACSTVPFAPLHISGGSAPVVHTYAALCHHSSHRYPSATATAYDHLRTRARQPPFSIQQHPTQRIPRPRTRAFAHQHSDPVSNNRPLLFIKCLGPSAAAR